MPYLDLLASALESDSPIFSLEFTDSSRRELDAAEERNYTNASDADLVNKLGTMFDESGALNSIGTWWYRTLGANVTQGMTRYQANGAILTANGQDMAGRVLPAFGEWITMKKNGADEATAFPSLLNVFTILGIYDEVHDIAVHFHDGDTTEAQMYDQLWPLFFRHLATAFDYSESRYTDKYTSERNQGTGGIDAANDALMDFQNDLNTIVQGVLKARLDKLDQVVFPPEIMKQVIGVEPMVEPTFKGLPEHSQLARVALEADVYCKSLMNLTGATPPGYQNYFDWARARHEAAENEDGHIWTSPNGFEISESADGRTMRFGRTAMRLHMERYVAGGKSVPEQRLDDYATMLTNCYDNLAEQAPILNELREATKVVAVAQWLKRHNVAVSLPKDGRVYWNAPRELPGIIYLTMAANTAQAGQINEILTTEGGIDFCGDNDLKYAVGSPEAPHSSSFSEDAIKRTADKIEQSLGKTLGGPPAPRPVGWTSSETGDGQTVSTVSVATGELKDSVAEATMQKSAAGTQMWKKGELEDAEKLYRAMAEAAKDDPKKAASARLLLAEVLHEEGNDAAAIKELNAALRLSPDLPLAQLLYAKALAESGDATGAQEALRSYLLLEPTNLAAIKVLADLGDTAGAQQALRTYLQMQPRDLAAVKALEEMGDLRGAEAALQTYVKLDPSNTAAAAVLADVQQREKQGVVPAVNTTPAGGAPVASTMAGFGKCVSVALDPNGPDEILKNTPFGFTDIKPLILKPLPIIAPNPAQAATYQKLNEERAGLVKDYQEVGLQIQNLEVQKAAAPSTAPEVEKQEAPLKQQQAELKPKIEKVEKDMISIPVSFPGTDTPSTSSDAAGADRRWAMKRVAYLLLAVLLLTLACAACADEKIPGLAQIPSNLPAQERDAFAKQRAVLVAEYQALKARVDAHNHKSVPKDSPEAQALQEEADQLTADIKKHFQACHDFGVAVECAHRLHDKSNQWVAITAPITNDKDHRTAYEYARVIDQFNVEESERYQPHPATYCNIFAWDVTRAMGAELPHWVLKSDESRSATDQDGKPTVSDDQREELNVNATVAWLKKHGNDNGWRRVDARGAQQFAAEGRPAVAIWANPQGEHGHIAMIRPGTAPHETGGLEEGVAVAQAGGKKVILEAAHLAEGFHDPDLEKTVEYWYHE